jgi:hypothetical protein
MMSFDADLVGRWFRRARNRDEPVMPHWGIEPTDQEAEAVRLGGEQVLAAVVADQATFPVPVADLTELPARLVLSYLTALAAGVAGTRAAFAASPESAALGDSFGGQVSATDTSDVGASGSTDVGAMALVAGLNAGAAALHGEIVSPAHRPAEPGWRGTEPTAAESARQAGVAAAELVVDGAGLPEITSLAADVAMAGWRIGVPDDPIDRIEYRTRGLLGILLVALELETRDPEPAGEPASCGAAPGENNGSIFDAEITFTMGLAPADMRALSDDLAGLVSELVVWPGRDSRNSWPRFHLHTEQPAEVIGQVYAYGTPFDLAITNRD